MELLRIHAFSITPQRTIDIKDIKTPPEGGEIPINKKMRQIVKENIDFSLFEKRTLVDFIFLDEKSRSNEIRDLILAFAFENVSNALSSSTKLARKLSLSMDFRSDPSLFIIASLGENETRQVALWLFPRVEAFQLLTGKGTPNIQYLTDIFSGKSNLRKAALFTGRRLRNEFISGRVLDFKGNKSSSDIANFWIGSFLQCGFSIQGEAGTRLLARTIKTAYDNCDDPADQEQLFTAMLAIRTSPRARWSQNSFAKEYLSGKVKEIFLDSIPNKDSQADTFEFTREVFEKVLQFRIFKLDTGVYVSSPIEEINSSVIIIGGAQRILKCEGVIVEEKVRVSRA